MTPRTFTMTARNRIIYLQEPVVARDSFGGEVTTWTTRSEVWASFENIGKNTERYIRDASKVHVFRMGQFGILPPQVRFDERWRIQEVDGRRLTWDVVGIGKGSRSGDWTVTVKG